MSLGRQRVLIILCCAIVAGIPLMVFQDVLGFEFLNYDDDIYITGNPVIQSLHARHIGIIHYQRGERSEAARCLERAVASEPFSTRAFLSLGIVYNETGQRAKARGLFRDVARLGSPEAQQLLAAENEA